MSVPKIQGIEAYPELEKKFINQYRAAARRQRCARCAKSKVIQRFRRLLAERQMRDKGPGKS